MAGNNKNVPFSINGRIVPASVDRTKSNKRGTYQVNRDTRGMDAILNRVISGETFWVRLRSGIQNAQLKLHQAYETSTPNAIDVLIMEILKASL